LSSIISRRKDRLLGALGATIILSGLANGVESVVHSPGPNHDENPYSVVHDWLHPFAPPGFVWGSHPGIFVESDNRIFIIQRGQLHVPEPKPVGFLNFYGSAAGLSALQPIDRKRDMRNVIFIVDRNGKLIESWTQWDYLFADTPGPHKIVVNPFDAQRRVWVVNDARHQVHVFSNDGKQLLFSLGTWNEAGTDQKHFGRPQDVAWLADGSILVADGNDNSRVVKFDRDGNYVLEWGTKGSAAGQFNVVHGIATDQNNRVYVADRSNDRIQVFDAFGKHLATWPDLNFPNHIIVTANQDVWVADNQPVRMVKFDTDGNRLYSWDADGRGSGQFAELHQFGIDAHGTWYGADNILGRSQKFVPKPSADPKTLMSAPLPLKN
jgi:DNA-binding beta-propeller fold protein YncE